MLGTRREVRFPSPLLPPSNPFPLNTRIIVQYAAGVVVCGAVASKVSCRGCIY